ncbi:MAG: response regulator, partial [Saprospiraceae bacterium]|nr:response regulator [Saprospiraceae bacterium]
MKVLIVEDEKLAREYLEELLEKSDYPIEIIGRVDSVKNGLKWFLKNPHPDLVFMDIDLGDGLCFEIFDAIDINSPVIFTTAYDAYAIKAFKVNSIDYLLKPFDLDSLNKALEKFSKWGQPIATDPVKKDTNQLLLPSFKERFIIKIGSHLKTI